MLIHNFVKVAGYGALSPSPLYHLHIPSCFTSMMQGRWPGMELSTPPPYNNFVFPFSLLLGCKEVAGYGARSPSPIYQPRDSPSCIWSSQPPPLYIIFVISHHSSSSLTTNRKYWIDILQAPPNHTHLHGCHEAEPSTPA